MNLSFLNVNKERAWTYIGIAFFFPMYSLGALWYVVVKLVLKSHWAEFLANAKAFNCVCFVCSGLRRMWGLHFGPSVLVRLSWQNLRRSPKSTIKSWLTATMADTQLSIGKAMFCMFSEECDCYANVFAALLTSSLISVKTWISQCPHLKQACTEDLFLTTFLRCTDVKTTYLYVCHPEPFSPWSFCQGDASSAWNGRKKSLTTSMLSRPACRSGLISK